MQIKSDYLPYLYGNQFSSALGVEFDFAGDDRRLYDRLEWLEERVRGKRIIHVGCVDHNAEMVDYKRRKGRWLHERLDNAAAACYGVDLDEKGIDYIRSLGFEDVSATDIVSTSDPRITGGQWDCLVVAEVLEHIGDPVSFLRTLRERYAGHVSELILTIPNALSYEIHRKAMCGQEYINTDHRYWFTPYTISKVLTEAGLETQEISMISYGVKRSFLKKWFFRRHPLVRQNIGVRARFLKAAEA